MIDVISVAGQCRRSGRLRRINEPIDRIVHSHNTSGGLVAHQPTIRSGRRSVVVADFRHLREGGKDLLRVRAAAATATPRHRLLGHLLTLVDWCRQNDCNRELTIGFCSSFAAISGETTLRAAVTCA
jgi:hypothetical protein